MKHGSMFNLRQELKDYLELNELQIDYLFEHYPKYQLHTAFSLALNYYQDLPNKLNEKRGVFKSRLLKFKETKYCACNAPLISDTEKRNKICRLCQ